MKVSLITSCYNREKTIRDSIESVLSQDYDDIEYIVVDGASKDSTMSIVNEYRDRISIIVSEPDHGMYEGINKGIKLATGDIVGLIHSDDVFYASDTISTIVREFERTRAELVYGNGLFVKPTDMNYVVRNWKSGDYVQSRLKRGWLPLHTTVYVKRSVFDKVGYYNEKYKISADSDWLLRCLYKNSLRVSYIDDYIIRMRMGGASTSFSKTMEKWREDIDLYHRMGLNPYFSLTCKVLSKIPQFARAKLHHWWGTKLKKRK
ncbi:MAG: glycosyltransferase [Bacteroidales bacterium]|nr:glycosyltransferase [Bacteroidales bacterium]